MQHFNESPLRNQLRSLRAFSLLALTVLAGCATVKPQPVPVPVAKPAPSKPAPAEKPAAAGMASVLRQATWQDLPEWPEENPALAWEPFLASCKVLSRQEAWREVCAAAEALKDPDRQQA